MKWAHVYFTQTQKSGKRHHTMLLPYILSMPRSSAAGDAIVQVFSVQSIESELSMRDRN